MASSACRVRGCRYWAAWAAGSKGRPSFTNAGQDLARRCTSPGAAEFRQSACQTLSAAAGGRGIDSGRVSMVQGASRGLGFEFVRQLLGTTGDGQVVATCRNPESAKDLQALQAQYCNRLSVLPLDVTDERSIKDAANSIDDLYGGLDLLVNTAGILHIPKYAIELLVALRRDWAWALEIRLTRPYVQDKRGRPCAGDQTFCPLLKVGRERDHSKAPAVVANLSARVGSISDNQIGGWYSYRASKSALNQCMEGWYSYRASKSALNQLTKTASVELARQKAPVVLILLHPGTVDTDLSKPFQRNVPVGKLFTREYSVQKLLEIIERVDLKDSGKFFAWDGQEIPW